MQALSRTSIGWGWSVMVYLTSAVDIGSKVGQVLLSCGEEGGIAESSTCTYVCVLCVHVCDSVRVRTCMSVCALAAGMYFTEFTFVFKRSIAIVQTCKTNVKVYLYNSPRISPNHCEKC